MNEFEQNLNNEVSKPKLNKITLFLKLLFVISALAWMSYSCYSLYNYYFYPDVKVFEKFKQEATTSFNTIQDKYNQNVSILNDSIKNNLLEQTEKKSNVSTKIEDLLSIKSSLCVEWYYKNIYTKIVDKKKENSSLKIKRLWKEYEDKIQTACRKEYFLNDIKKDIVIPQLTADLYFPSEYKSLEGLVYSYTKEIDATLANYSENQEVKVSEVKKENLEEVKQNVEVKSVENKEETKLEFLYLTTDNELMKLDKSLKEKWEIRFTELRWLYKEWKIINQKENLYFVFENWKAVISQAEAAHLKNNWILATDFSTYRLPQVLYAPKEVDTSNKNYQYRKNKLRKDAKWIINSWIQGTDNYVWRFISLGLDDWKCKLVNWKFENCVYEVFLGHVSEMFEGIKNWDIVKTGQPIWISGWAVFLKDNGVTTGPHIHLEKRVYGYQSPYFPMYYQNLDYVSQDITSPIKFK